MFNPGAVRNLVSVVRVVSSIPGGSWCLSTLKPIIEWGVAKYCGAESSVSMILNKCDDVIIKDKLPSISIMLNKLDEKDWKVISSLSSYAYENSFITVRHIVDLVDVLYKIKDDLQSQSLEFLKDLLDGVVINEYAIKIISACDENITQKVCPKLLDALSKLEKDELLSLLSKRVNAESIALINKLLPEVRGIYAENRDSVKALLKVVFAIESKESDMFLACDDLQDFDPHVAAEIKAELHVEYREFFWGVKESILHADMSSEGLIISTCG